MDSVTQAVLGAAVAEAGMGGKRLGKPAIFWGLGLGTLPDLDVLANPWLDQIGQLEWHRGASHSLLVMVLLSPVFGWIIGRLHPVISWPRATVTVFFIFFTHVLIDLFTVYGTQLWWPFSDARLGTNNFFIIDPLFTLPLLLGVGIAFFSRSALLRSRANWTGLCLAGVITVWSLGARSVAEDRFLRALAAQGIEHEKLLVTPTPLNTILWRGLVKTPDQFLAGYYSVWPGVERGEIRFFPVAGRGEFPERWADTREAERLAWFADGFYSVEEKSGVLVFSDWRFGELRDFARPWDEEGNDPQPIFAWELLVGPEGELELRRRLPNLSRRGFLPVLWQRLFAPDAFP